MAFLLRTIRNVTTASPATSPADSPLALRTAPVLWQYVLEQRWPAPAYLEEQADGWREVSWDEAGRRVEALSHALLARGVQRGDVVAVLARTRLEWILLDWAIMNIGAVVVGIYPTNTAAESDYILGHSEAVLAFAEDDAQRDKLLAVKDNLPQLREVLTFAQLPELEAEGKAHAESNPDALEAAALEIGEDDLGTLIYTSGTTGPPKGCMLTHKNLVTAAVRVRTNMPDGGDTVLLFLPLAHTFGRLAHQAAAFYGSTVALVAEATRVAEALGAVHPTILPAGPPLYQKNPSGRPPRHRKEKGGQP